MSTEIPLLNLITWFEEHANTPTLSIVRRVVQGFFPTLPNTQVTDLGKLHQDIKALHQQIGEHDFEEWVACQCEGYKHARSETGEGFYPGYIVGGTSMHNVERYGEKISLGYQTVDSEVYRSCYPVECDILKEYFRRFMSDPTINYDELRESFIPTAQHLWVYHAFSSERAKELGDEAYEKWKAGRTRVASKKLGNDILEYTRAALKALVSTALQFSPIAKDFKVMPDSDEYPLHLQVAFQFLERKDEFMKETLPFSVTVGATKIHGN